MKKRTTLALLALSLTAAGLVYAGQAHFSADQSRASAGFVCPATGEPLACPACCPLNQ